MAKPQGVGAVAAERLTNERTPVTTVTSRERPLDVGHELVQELLLEPRCNRVVARALPTLGVLRVPVDPVTVEAGRRTVTTGDGTAVRGDEDGVERRLGHPLCRVAVLPWVSHAVRVLARTRAHRLDVRRWIVTGAEHRRVAATETVQQVEDRTRVTESRGTRCRHVVGQGSGPANRW